MYASVFYFSCLNSPETENSVFMALSAQIHIVSLDAEYDQT